MQIRQRSRARNQLAWLDRFDLFLKFLKASHEPNEIQQQTPFSNFELQYEYHFGGFANEIKRLKLDKWLHHKIIYQS